MPNILENVWPEWRIEKELGRGSYGIVYQAVRDDSNIESRAAIKIIPIPANSAEIDTLRSEGFDIETTRSYIQEIVNDFINEIRLMESLKGVQNIVSIEDYKVIEKKDEIGWDIFIRMELLTPFNVYVCDKTLTESDVIELGCDICTALEVCARRGVIHRDIKPENMFVNDFGDYKLGDFGIARKLENMTTALSQKGTFSYMAPEIVFGSSYDARVDTYSLGLVLYRLLNENRFPFLNSNKQILSPNERKRAVERRIRGELLPPPSQASPAMAHIVLKACAHDPDDRFSSASEFKAALRAVKDGIYIVPGSTAPMFYSYDQSDKTMSRNNTRAEQTVPVRHAEKYVENVSVIPDRSADHKTDHDPNVSAHSKTASFIEREVDGQISSRTEDRDKVPGFYEKDNEKTTKARPIKRTDTAPANTSYIENRSYQKKQSTLKSKKSALIIACSLVLVVLLGLGIWVFEPFKARYQVYDADNPPKGIVVFGDHNALNEKTFERVEITKEPNKTTYYIGERLDLSGLEVKTDYVNNTNNTHHSTLPSNYRSYRTSKILDTVGTQKVYVVYGDRMDSFEITVKEKTDNVKADDIYDADNPPDGNIVFAVFTPNSYIFDDKKLEYVSIKKTPDKTTYYIGETIDLTGLAVNIYFSYNTNDMIYAYINRFVTASKSLDTLGTQKVYVVYGDRMDSFEITVKEK